MKQMVSMLLLLTFFIPYSADAVELSDRLSFDGSIRLRYEFMDGFNDKLYGRDLSVGEDRDGFLLTRIRAGLTYRFNESLLAKVSIQDSRAFDWSFSDSDWYSKEFYRENNPHKDYLELSETYLKGEAIGGTPFGFTAGRQKISYGDKRVFGPGEWKNSGKWVWDALKLSYKRGADFVDIFFGKSMLHDPDTFSLSHRHGYDGAALYGHYEVMKDAAVEPMVIFKGNDRENDLYEEMRYYYAGLRVYHKNLQNFFFDGTYVRQWGNLTGTTGSEVDVKAYGYHAEGGYRFTGLPMQPKLGIGFSYATGDDTSTKDMERFDGVFGASDLYYGRMNLMNWSNLEDYEASVEVKPCKGVMIKPEFHLFYLADNSDVWRKYKNKPGNHFDHIGNEFDIVTTYDYSKHMQFQAGYGYFQPGDFIEGNKIAFNTAQWLFFQIMYTF